MSPKDSDSIIGPNDEYLIICPDADWINSDRKILCTEGWVDLDEMV